MVTKSNVSASPRSTQVMPPPFDGVALKSCHARLAEIVSELSLPSMSEDQRNELTSEREKLQADIGQLLRSEEKSRYFTAQDEQQAAYRKLADIDKQLPSATGSASEYSRLSSERQAVLLEVERLDRLMPSLKAAYDAQMESERNSSLHFRAALQRSKNAVLAERIRIDLARITIELRGLIKDVATATIETDALNKDLPSGEEYIVDPNAIARGRPSQPREIVSVVEKSLWVFETTGRLIGNQDDVISIDANTGRLQPHDVRCAKRRFKVTTYLPEQRTIHAEPLFELISIPNHDGPGASFIGEQHSIFSSAQIEIAATSLRQPARAAQLDLMPLGEWRGTVSVNETLASGVIF